MTPDFEVAVVGAGVAGLAATRKLASAGRRVICIEARDRIGGRIFTLHDPLAPLPIELGAEFVHGRPPEIWEIVRAAELTVYDCAESSRRVRDGKIQPESDAWQQIDRVMQEMEQAADSRDESFAAFLKRSAYPSDIKELAASYVEGFNAARKEIVGIRSLAKDARAADAIDGDRSFRLLSGYDAVPLHLVRGIPSEKSELRLSTVLEEVRWQAGDVHLHCTHALTGGRHTIRARKGIFTLPLGVLQSNEIRWSPAPQRKLEAARALASGQVARVVLRFRESFWEERKELADTGFWFSNEQPFPTWWTTLAVRAAVLTGWSAGPHADALLGKPREQVIQAAVESLAKILNVKISVISEQLSAAYFHDWHGDRFARGAYSYVPANAENASEELAASVDDTLFFAGEATELNGHSATVHGAIASGLRAAEEILQ